MKILKFGGTSVGSAERIKLLPGLLNKPGKKIVVFSAMVGITNQLVEICNLLYQNKRVEAEKIAVKLSTQFTNTAVELLQKPGNRDEFEDFLQPSINQIRFHSGFLMNQKKENEILATGELLTAKLIALYFEDTGLHPVLLNVLDFMRVDKDHEPDYYYIEEKLMAALANNPGNDLFLTQGFICRNVFGEIDNLGRGGSDYSATILGAVLNCDEVQIWTDITGVHNNDPRYVKNTHPIAHLSYHEAAELAYFGARIIHPLTMIPCMDKNIPVWLKNTFKPKENGTLISSEVEGKGIKAVAVKDGIAVIKIKSGRMLQAYGFLRRIFETFEEYKTPVDVITTSEVAVSMTIDDLSHVKEITSTLEKLGHVEVELDQAIICIVGNFIAEEKGYAKKIFNALEDVPIRMISYGGSFYNMTLVVHSAYKKQALEALNNKLEFVS